MFLQAAEDINDAQNHVLANNVKAYFGEDLSGMAFAMWGLSFKPNTDDMRETLSGGIIDELRTAGAKVRA